MEFTGVVIILALGQYFSFAFQVARLREKLGVPATEASENQELVRAVRVHANTGEMLIVFVPLVGLCAYFFDPRVAAGVGVFWIVARFFYRRGYLRDVKGRIPGFIMGDVVLALLALGAALRHRQEPVHTLSLGRYPVGFSFVPPRAASRLGLVAPAGVCV